MSLLDNNNKFKSSPFSLNSLIDLKEKNINLLKEKIKNQEDNIIYLNERLKNYDEAINEIERLNKEIKKLNEIIRKKYIRFI